MNCDFCCAATPAFRYPAKSFIAEHLTVEINDGRIVEQSTGVDWSACHVCHKLIEADNRVALAVRATSSFLQTCPELVPNAETVYSDMKQLHDAFFDNRTGPAEPLDRTQAVAEAKPPQVIHLASQEESRLLVALANAGLTLEEAEAFLRTDMQGASAN